MTGRVDCADRVCSWSRRILLYCTGRTGCIDTIDLGAGLRR
jgi:hypothetical protein